MKSYRRELQEKTKQVIDLECKLESYEQNMKENRFEMDVMETKLQKKNELLIELESKCVDVQNLHQLQGEIDAKNSTIGELQETVAKLEAYAHRRNSLHEIDDLMEVLNVKEKRIAELEDALRESVQISTEREGVLQREEAKRKRILEKVTHLKAM